MKRLLPVLLALVGLPLLAKPGLLPDLPGAKVDGSVLLPNQWSLRPVGKQVVIGDFPVNLAVHPSGKFVVALHAGYGQHELVSVALPEGKVIARVALGDAFYGLAFSPDGTMLITGSLDETAALWDTATGTQLLKREGHSGTVSS
ncbi:MAG: WD40 repeat domain-containing protein, partial [Verrucomicrobiota bacterium]